MIANIRTKTINFFFFEYYFVPVCSFNDFRQTATDVYSLCISIQLQCISELPVSGCKPDTSLRRTVELGPDGARLRESSMYYQYGRIRRGKTSHP